MVPTQKTAYTNEPEPDYFDDLDREIALMSNEEVIAEILASAGMWSDRDDLDDIMDRTDRIEELYAPYKTDPPDTSI